MDSVTLSMQNRLFWLGRYSERVYTTIQFTLDEYDRLIDGTGDNHVEFCQNMGIPCPYSSGDEFLRHYLFDKDFPWSIASSVENMLGNGMVLRETISTPTLAYLQMAHNAMELAAQSSGPMVQLQWVLDDIMAFRGSLDDGVDSETIRNVIKSGGFVERLSLMLRNHYRLERLDAELRKLLNRLYKTDLQVDRDCLDVITAQAMEGKPVEPLLLLHSIEHLFLV